MVYTITRAFIVIVGLVLVDCYTVTEYQYFVKNQKCRVGNIILEIRPENNYDGENKVKNEPYKLFVTLCNVDQKKECKVDSLIVYNKKRDRIIYQFNKPDVLNIESKKDYKTIDYVFYYLILPREDLVIDVYYELSDSIGSQYIHFTDRAIYRKLQYKTSVFFEAIMGI